MLYERLIKLHQSYISASFSLSSEDIHQFIVPKKPGRFLTYSLFAKIMADFIAKEQKNVAEFISGDYSLFRNLIISWSESSANQFRSQILFHNINIGSEILFYETSVFDVLENYFKRKPFTQGEINCLGYGCGSGSFEFKISSFQKMPFNIYGYDPFIAVDQKNKKIDYISNLEKLSDDLNWDLICSRWVLHHISEKERWESFKKALSALRPGSRIVIQEEGLLFLDKRDYELSHINIYKLILSCWDLAITNFFLPTWSSRQSLLQGEYYLDYLVSQDFQKFENTILESYHFEKHIQICEPGFNQQYLIVYEIKE